MTPHPNEVTNRSDEEHHPSPLRRLIQMLNEDRGDLLALSAYIILTGILTLAIPLTAQFAVNTIAAGIYLQPLIVLTIAAFVALLFAGVLRLLKLSLLERLQQRVFARVALRLAERMPYIRQTTLVNHYAPQLV
ncbi:MAG TPA: ABC transporter, partial [Blastocatellia bacterium]|nr:ABC transporter [Blastocatellia bacterium]